MTTEIITQKVKDVIVDKLNVEESEVTLTSTFKDDLGADSLDTVELIMAFEKKFDIKIADEEAEKVLTVGKAIECVEKILKEQEGK